MKFSESLKRNSDFQRVYREGKSYANRYLVLYVLQNQQCCPTQNGPADPGKLQTTGRHVQ